MRDHLARPTTTGSLTRSVLLVFTVALVLRAGWFALMATQFGETDIRSARQGMLDTLSIRGPGFGYRYDELDPLVV